MTSFWMNKISFETVRLGRRPMVGLQNLGLAIMVRIHASQPLDENPRGIRNCGSTRGERVSEANESNQSMRPKNHVVNNIPAG